MNVIDQLVKMLEKFDEIRMEQAIYDPEGRSGDLLWGPGLNDQFLQTIDSTLYGQFLLSQTNLLVNRDGFPEKSAKMLIDAVDPHLTELYEKVNAEKEKIDSKTQSRSNLLELWTEISEFYDSDEENFFKMGSFELKSGARHWDNIVSAIAELIDDYDNQFSSEESLEIYHEGSSRLMNARFVGLANSLLEKMSVADQEAMQKDEKVKSIFEDGQDYENLFEAVLAISNLDLESKIDQAILNKVIARGFSSYYISKLRVIENDLQELMKVLFDPNRKFILSRDHNLNWAEVVRLLANTAEQFEKIEVKSLGDIAELMESAYEVVELGEAQLTRAKEVSDIVDAAEQYSEVLLKKFRQMTYIDEYDSLELGEFKQEIKRFISKKLSHISHVNAETLLIGIFSYVSQLDSDNKQDSNLTEKELTPQAYEQLCAEILRQQGWSTRLTAMTGDQGVDVIAEKDGLKLVVQCKLYNSPVGNKAVQEVLGAKQYEDADFAAVVSNAPFTVSAKLLAQKAGVLLLHHDDLKQIGQSL